MTIQQKLDKYCIARCVRDTKTQIEVADDLVDEEIPTMINRMAELMMDRNRLVNEREENDERETNP